MCPTVCILNVFRTSRHLTFCVLIRSTDTGKFPYYFRIIPKDSIFTRSMDGPADAIQYLYFSKATYMNKMA